MQMDNRDVGGGQPLPGDQDNNLRDLDDPIEHDRNLADLQRERLNCVRNLDTCRDLLRRDYGEQNFPPDDEVLALLDPDFRQYITHNMQQLRRVVERIRRLQAPPDPPNPMADRLIVLLGRAQAVRVARDNARIREAQAQNDIRVARQAIQRQLQADTFKRGMLQAIEILEDRLDLPVQAVHGDMIDHHVLERELEAVQNPEIPPSEMASMTPLNMSDRYQDENNNLLARYHIPHPEPNRNEGERIARPENRIIRRQGRRVFSPYRATVQENAEQPPQRRPRLEVENGQAARGLPPDFELPQEPQRGPINIVREPEVFGNVGPQRVPLFRLIPVDVVRVEYPRAAREKADRQNAFINNVLLPESANNQILTRFLDQIRPPNQDFDIVQFMKEEGLLPRAEVEANEKSDERVTHNEMVKMVSREEFLAIPYHGQPDNEAILQNAQRNWIQLCYKLITTDMRQRHDLWTEAIGYAERERNLRQIDAPPLQDVSRLMDCQIATPIGRDRLASESIELNESTSDDDPITTAISPIDCSDQPGINGGVEKRTEGEDNEMKNIEEGCNIVPSTSAASIVDSNGSINAINNCPACRSPGEPHKFRKSVGRPKRGQVSLNRWLWKLKCTQCNNFFGDIVDPRTAFSENDPTLSSSELAEQKTAAGSVSTSRSVSSETPEPLHETNYEEKTCLNETTESPDVMTVPEDSKTAKKGGRQRQTVRKNTVNSSSPALESAQLVEEIPQKPKLETSKEKNAKKRAAERDATEGPPSKMSKEANSLMATVLLRLGLDTKCLEETSISEQLEKPSESLIRALKVNEIMKLTIERLTKENGELKASLQDIQGKVTEIGTAAKNQMGCVRAAVDTLAKELTFFRNEVLSEARTTNDAYKKRQEEFETKYGYREQERDMANDSLKLSEEKLKQVRSAMKNMGEDMARMENEIRYFEDLKRNAETGKYMKCQSCTANEVLVTKMRGELVIVRKEREEWETRLKAVEKQKETDIEHIKAIEAELKRQTFLARSYEALDKQNRARELETTARATPPTPRPRDEPSPSTKIAVKVEAEKNKKQPEVKKKQAKEEDLTIRPLSDIVDPEILAQAEKMANAVSTKVKMPDRNMMGSVAVTPESPFSSETQPKSRPDSRLSGTSQIPHRPPSNYHQKSSSSRQSASFSDSPWEKQPEEKRKPEPEPTYHRRIDWASYLAEQKRKN